MHALVLAGGRGTRLRPLTLVRPKPMVPFVGAPFAEGLVRQLAAAGVDRVSLLVGSHQTSAMAPLAPVAARLGVDLDVVTEDEPLDTAGAARRVLAGTSEQDVVVCNGDMLSDVDHRELVDAHRAAGAVATLAVKHVEDVSSYGVLELDDDGTVTAFLEKPGPGTTTVDTVNAGAYVLDARAFAPHPGDGPLSFEYDVFPALLANDALVRGVDLPAHWQDLGTPDRYLAGTAAVLEGRCAWPVPTHLRRHRDQRPSLVADDAVVGDGAVVDRSVVDKGCSVGRDAQVVDTVLFPGATVGPGAFVRGAVVGAGAHVPAGVRVEDQVVPDAEHAVT